MVESTGQKKPLQVKCWKCRGDHYLNKCLERKNRDASMYNVQEAYIVGEVARRIPCIYETLENHQAYHQSLMIEIEGKINNLPVSI